MTPASIHRNGPLVPAKSILAMHADALKEAWKNSVTQEALDREYWICLQDEMKVADACELPDDTAARLCTLLELASRR